MRGTSWGSSGAENLTLADDYCLFLYSLERSSTTVLSRRASETISCFCTPLQQLVSHPTVPRTSFALSDSMIKVVVSRLIENAVAKVSTRGVKLRHG